MQTSEQPQNAFDFDPSQTEIMVLADDIRGKTGFATNGRLITWALSEHWNVVSASAGAPSPAVTEWRGRKLHILPYETDPDTRYQQIGRESLARLISQVQPSIVISVLDIQMCRYLANIRLPKNIQVDARDLGQEPSADEILDSVKDEMGEYPDAPRFKWIAQVPIDGEYPLDDWEPFFEEVDYPVAMSEFGERVIDEYIGDFDVDVIPHAAEMPEGRNTEPDRFVLGTVNENQFRKQYPRLIEAWGKFYERAGRPDDVWFYVHARRNSQWGWPLEKYFKKYGIEQKVMPYRGKVDRQTLADTYASFDLFCSSTGGEGFGLTAVEAMTQGVPVVITDYTTSDEVVLQDEPSPRGKTIVPLEMYDEMPRFAAVERALVDTNVMAGEILDYYENQDKIEEHGQNAKEWVERELAPEKVGQMWVDKVNDVIRDSGQ